MQQNCIFALILNRDSVIMISSTIIEDDAVQAEILGALLDNHNINSKIVDSYDGACRAIESGLKSDVVILDYDLGNANGDGIELCRRIHSTSDVPIVILTGHKTSDVVIDFLNAGADRFVSKPYKPEDLLGCIDSLLGRECNEGDSSTNADQLRPILNFNLMKVSYKGQEFSMSSKELELFELLLDNEGKTVFRQDINFLLNENPVNRRYADTLVTKLRSRLSKLPGDFRIRSVRGTGYQLFRKG